MKRRLFTNLSALSLLLFVAVVGLWVRSYVVYETWLLATLPTKAPDLTWDDDVSLWSVAGGLTVSRMPRPRLELERHQVWLDLRVDGDDDLPVRRRKLAWLLEDVRHEGTTTLGFMFQRSPVPGYFAVSVPYWFFAAMTAVLPLLWTLRHLRARSARSSNSCPSCGYNLRATPHRYPECGATPAEETT